MPPSTILLATTNAHKVAEFRACLAGIPARLVTAEELGVRLPAVVEDGANAAEIARTKAVTIAQACRCAALADDTVLEVDALQGRPGLRTARYAGKHASREANCQKLLAELTGVPDGSRQARFVCCLQLAGPDGEPLASARGECRGQILTAAEGTGGFGYDAFFWVAATGCSMAALDDPQRRRVTHRARASQRLLEATWGLRS
jgi:XTP/dITP diphosphohydrolase